METQLTKQQVDFATRAYRHRLAPEGDRCSTCKHCHWIANPIASCMPLNIYMEDTNRSVCPLYERLNIYST